MGDEVGDEGQVFLTLGDGPGARHQPPGLDAGKPTEPGELHLVVAECGDGRGVGLDGHVAHLDVELVDLRPVLAQVPDCEGPLEGTLQLWPHRHGTDAMFMALLRRRLG